MKSVTISKKIVGLAVVSKDDKSAVQEPIFLAAPVLAESNPLDARIERRPEGELEATSTKIEFSTQAGKQKLYLIISYMPFEGVVNGEKVTIERPVEFFLPAGQVNEDHQWVMATMRNLSLCARAGFVTKALQDLRSVTWTKGPVRCGMKDYGEGVIKPVTHDSEVSAIAWSIQQALFNRGFLDCDGGQVPARLLAKRYKARYNTVEVAELAEVVQIDVKPKAEVKYTAPTGAICPECKEASLTKQSGCDVCPCGYSKCS